MLSALLLGLGAANLYCNAAELYSTALHGDAYEHAVWIRRFVGPHAWSTWALALCALAPVHVFWLPSLRRSAAALAAVGALVAFGTFGDHFMVIVTTLQHDFLPSAAQPYAMNLWEVATFLGSAGLFATALLIAVRVIPVVSILEMRRLAEAGHG